MGKERRGSSGEKAVCRYLISEIIRVFVPFSGISRVPFFERDGAHCLLGR